MGEIGNTVVKVAEVMVSPLNKLIDAFCGACGKIFEPIQIKRIAKAKAFELKTISEAIESNTELAQTYNNGMVQIDNGGLNDLALRAAQRALFQETVKQQNIESVFQQAAGLLEDEPDVTAEPIGQDWMARFINSIETISDTDMQFLWAKVLAGEIKRPKSCSLRTLDTLMNLSKEEALLFQQMSPYIIKQKDECYFINQDELLKKTNINLDNIISLSECGLVNDSSFLTVSFDLEPNRDFCFHNENLLIYCNNSTETKKSLSFGIYVLTSVGKNLCEILDNKTDDNFFLEFAKHLKQRFKDIDIHVYKVTEIKERQITYDKTVDLLN